MNKASNGVKMIRHPNEGLLPGLKPMFELKLLGGVKLLDAAGTEITLRSRKVRALIAYLALGGAPHGRDNLATLLWGDRLDAQARQSLRQALLTLRKWLGDSADSVVQSDDKSVALNTAEIRIDAVQFEELAHSGSLEAAAAIYDGDLAEGLNEISEPFDDWLAAERLRLHELAGDVWTRLGEQRLQASNFDSAIDAGRRLVAMDPLGEPGHRLLMSAYSAAGRRADGLQHYATFAETLRNELDTAPDPETQKLAERIRSDERAGDAERVDSQPTALPDPRPLVDRPLIAVLAFENMSGDPEQEYFADGITDDIITALSKSRMFFVMARNSTFTYKGKKVDVRQIARELGVQYVLEGSVRRAGDRVR
ncbi:MAG: BTAD domain-containing putative transcriptional regulator, partial [Gammaproteobacteria bacterium]|nr:BTAD domain-containing putative transcriptional regulator [Gammaproteobacteria bacterium]